jgi:hypothetical protein
MADVSMPPRVAALPRDRRGYPIPFIVQRDGNGDPIFTMNDTRLVARAAREGLCGICGQRLGAFKALVGGPASAFHPRGAYYDGPMHRDCAEFALQVCPWLAVPRWSKRIGTRAVRPGAIPQGSVLIVEDQTMHPDQPPVFVMVIAKCVNRFPDGRHKPVRPYESVSYWRAGEAIDSVKARELIADGWTGICPIGELVWPT